MRSCTPRTQAGALLWGLLGGSPGTATAACVSPGNCALPSCCQRGFSLQMDLAGWSCPRQGWEQVRVPGWFPLRCSGWVQQRCPWTLPLPRPLSCVLLDMLWGRGSWLQLLPLPPSPLLHPWRGFQSQPSGRSLGRAQCWVGSRLCSPGRRQGAVHGCSFTQTTAPARAEGAGLAGGEHAPLSLQLFAPTSPWLALPTNRPQRRRHMVMHI